MNEHRGSTSEGIWIGLCVLLLLVTAVAGAFGFLQHRRAVQAAQAEYMARITSAQQAEAHHEATDLSADLSVKVHELEQRVGELEAENHELRQRLDGTSE
jgi:uncharacterized protein HemX